MHKFFIWAAFASIATAWAPSHRALASRRRSSFSLQALGGPSSVAETHLVENVPSDAVLSWLANDWARGVNRRDAAMPLVPSTEAWGLCLRFQACPDDSVEILVNPVNPSTGTGCMVTVRRGEGGTAATMGRQVASLVAAAERDVAARLAHDLRANFPTTVACEIKLDPTSGEILGVSVPGEDNSNLIGNSGNSAGNTKSGSPMVDAEIVPPSSSSSSVVVESSHEDEPELPPELANLDPSRLSDESVEALGRTALKAQRAEERRAAKRSDPQNDELTKEELDIFGVDSDLPPDFVAGVAEVAKAANMTAEEVAKVFARGSELAAAFSKDSDDITASSRSSSSAGGGELTSRRGVGALATSAEDFEAVDDELVRLSVSLASANGLDGGLDLFSGPNQGGAGPAGALAESAAGVARKAAAVAAVSAAQQEDRDQHGAGGNGGSGPKSGGVTSARLSFFRGPVDDPSTLAPSDAQALAQVSGSLALLVRELCRPGSSDLATQILGSYREVVLSEWYPAAARRYLATLPPEDADVSMDSSSGRSGSSSSSGGPPVLGGASSARAALTQINNYALVCAQELGDALAAAEHAQLEKVRRICDVAMDDMSKLPAAVAAMKPLLDDDLVAYLDYAIDKEREVCKGRGDDPDKAPTTWLQVLGLVRRGVYAELSKVILSL